MKLFHIERNKDVEFLLGNISQAEETNTIYMSKMNKLTVSQS